MTVEMKAFAHAAVGFIHFSQREIQTFVKFAEVSTQELGT